MCKDTKNPSFTEISRPKCALFTIFSLFSAKKCGKSLQFQKKAVPLHSEMRNKRVSLQNIGLWCNGNTADSGPAFPGSSPGSPTRERATNVALSSFFTSPTSSRRIIGSPYLKKEKLTLPQARCSTKRGCALKSWVLPCSRTSNPSSRSRPWSRTMSGMSARFSNW